MAYIDASHSTSPSKTVVITFSCQDDSLPVYILTSLNDWEPTLMTKQEDLSSEDDHRFQHTVVVKGGVSSILYKFRIGDNHFLHNDNAPAESDGFGGSNNIFVVPWTSEVPNTVSDAASTSSPTGTDEHAISDVSLNYKNQSQSTKCAHPPSIPETSSELPKSDHTVIAENGALLPENIQQEVFKDPANGTTSTPTPASGTPNGHVHLRPEKEIGQVDGVPDESTSGKPAESQSEVLIENAQERDGEPEPARAEEHQIESTGEPEVESKETDVLPEAAKQGESEQQRSDSATSDEHETKVHMEDIKGQDNEGLSARLEQTHKPGVAPPEQLTLATNVAAETDVAARETQPKELEKLVEDTEERGEVAALESKSASEHPTAAETDENVALALDELIVSPPGKPVTIESRDDAISETGQITVTNPEEPIIAKSGEPTIPASEEPIVVASAEAPEVEHDDTATALSEQRGTETIDQELSTTPTTTRNSKAEEIADSVTKREEMETDIWESELKSSSAKLQQEADKLKAYNRDLQSISVKLQQDANKLEALRMPLLFLAVAAVILALLVALVRGT